MGARSRRRWGLPVILLLITTIGLAACGGGGNGAASTAVAPSAGIDELVAAA